jgi:hypothetical protein
MDARPLQAALPFIPPVAPLDPTAPGPFSFAAPDRGRGMLANAGFHSVAINPPDARIGDECANYFRHADTRPGERNPV